MKFSLFRTGLAPRLIAAVAFGALAFGAVAMLEPQSPARDSSALGAPTAPIAPVEPRAGSDKIGRASCRETV